MLCSDHEHIQLLGRKFYARGFARPKTGRDVGAVITTRNDEIG